MQQRERKKGDGGREGRSVAGSGRSASALMMQWNLSLLICVQNPICIASFHSSKRFPPPAARPLEFFLSCHSPEEKYNIPLWLQLPLLWGRTLLYLIYLYWKKQLLWGIITSMSRHGVFQLWHLAMLLHCRGCFSGGQTGVWPALTHAHTPHIVHVSHLAQVSRGVCVRWIGCLSMCVYVWRGVGSLTWCCMLAMPCAH